VVTIQTQAEILAGLTPDNEVIASVSTIARTFSPTSVNRRTTVPVTTTASQARRRGDRLVPEQQQRGRRQGDGHADGGHDPDQR
jgi:hypothetical protein